QRVPAQVSAAVTDVFAFTEHEAAFRSLTRLTAPEDGFAATAQVVVGAVTVELDLSGAVDVEAERKRLGKDLANERQTREQGTRKLDSEQFRAKAPESEVEKIRARRVAAESEIARLEAQLAGLPQGPQ